MKRYFLSLMTVVTITLTGGCSMPGLYQVGTLKTSGLNFDAPAQQAQTNKWTLENGVDVFYFTQGTPKEPAVPVLMVHGGPGYPFKAAWKGLELTNAPYIFTYYHQRGCGKSSRPFLQFDMKDFGKSMQTLEKTVGLTAQIADIERIRRILKQDKLILIGHSFGGFIATLYALEFPERVKALILVSPADMLQLPQPSGGLYDEVRNLLPEAMKSKYDDYIKRYFDFGAIFGKTDAELTALNAEFIPYYIEAMKSKSGNASADEISTITDWSDIGGWMVQAIYMSLGQTYDIRDKLKSIAVPTMILYGEFDTGGVISSKQYASLIPNAKLICIPKTTHFSFDEKPAEFGQAVVGFLNGIK